MMNKQLSAAETAWRDGDFREAAELAEAHLQANPENHHVRRLLVLAAASIGDGEKARKAYAGIPERLRRDRTLDDAMLRTFWHPRDAVGARDFAASRGLLRNKAIAEQIRLAVDHPMHVEAPHMIALSYASDSFTWFMPGIAATVNGQDTVVRFDTGGSFIHMSRSQAATFGVAYAGCERSFAALTFGSVCHGVADLSFGGVLIANAPVAVHPDRIWPVDEVAKSFGVEMGPIIGTNIFGEFLTVFDDPAGRVLFYPGDADSAREQLFARYGAPETEISYAVINSHMILAKGRIAEEETVFFVDTGLAVVNAEGDQAALLISRTKAEALGMPYTASEPFGILSASAGFDRAERRDLRAFIVPDSTWKQFGDWHGVRVDALISHAYLKTFIWALDPNRQIIMLWTGQP